MQPVQKMGGNSMPSFFRRTDKNGRKRILVCVKCAGMKRRYATFDSMEKARSWAAKTESDMRQGKLKLSSAADHHTAGETIQRYIDQVLPTKSKKQRYPKLQKAQLLWWKHRIGVYTLSNLSQSVLAACRDELALGRSPATVNRYIAALSHVFTIAMKEWEWLDSSPITRLRKLKENRGRLRFLSDQEREALLDACRQEYRKPLYLIVVLAISTGARKQELLSLQWRDVDFDRNQIIVQETKNDERRALFIYGSAHSLLWQHHKLIRSAYVFPDRSGKNPVNIDREFKRACKAAKITDFHFHDLRHTAASYLAMNGATHSEIAEVLGHKTLNMVKRYAHLSKTHTANVVAAMNAKIFGGRDGGE